MCRKYSKKPRCCDFFENRAHTHVPHFFRDGRAQIFAIFERAYFAHRVEGQTFFGQTLGNNQSTQQKHPIPKQNHTQTEHWPYIPKTILRWDLLVISLNSNFPLCKPQRSKFFNRCLQKKAYHWTSPCRICRIHVEFYVEFWATQRSNDWSLPDVKLNYQHHVMRVSRGKVQKKIPFWTLNAFSFRAVQGLIMQLRAAAKPQSLQFNVLAIQCASTS